MSATPRKVSVGSQTSYRQLLETNLRRWAQGAEAFAKIAKRRTNNSSKVFRSAIYGNMEFDDVEMRLIESFYLQRLRHVSQMGLLNLVYPDARHSRFEHTLGVLWSLKSLIRADKEVRTGLTNADHRALAFAALLHDCGHGPFSHTTETLLEVIGIDKVLRTIVPGSAPSKPHERRARDMIHDKDFLLSAMGIQSYELGKYMSREDGNPTTVANLILGEKPSPLLNLLSGHFDVDKMDYFRRDAFFTGTMGGGVDMELMQRWIRMTEEDDKSVSASYDDRLAGHLLHLLFAREHVYNITAFHPVARVASALVIVAGDLMLRALPPDVGADILMHIELLDDRELLAILELASVEFSDHEIHGEGLLLQRVVQRLYLRRLPKRLCALSRREFARRFAPALGTLTEGSDSGESLVPIAYCRISEIAGGKYVKKLAEGTIGDDDIAILDLNPQLGPLREAFGGARTERKILKSISMVSKDQTVRRSLHGWIDDGVGPGAADVVADALYAYKLALWKALVLVPASLRDQLRGEKARDEFIDHFAVALSRKGVARPGAASGSAYADTMEVVGRQVAAMRDLRTTSKH